MPKLPTRVPETLGGYIVHGIPFPVETDPDTGEGSGVYSPATVGDADPGWICFLIAEK